MTFNDAERRKNRLENIDDNYILTLNAPHNDVLGFACDVVDELLAQDPNATPEQLCFRAVHTTLKLLKHRLIATPKEVEYDSKLKALQEEHRAIFEEYGEKAGGIIIANTEIASHNKNQKWPDSFKKARQDIGEEAYAEIVKKAMQFVAIEGRAYA